MITPLTVDTDALELPGWIHVYSGKVRDLYVPDTTPYDDDTWSGDPLARSSMVLVVASNRVSAFDHVLDPAIEGKGAVLTNLTRWWFEQLADVPNHLVEASDPALPEVPTAVADRATVCHTLDMFPVECVVRGYLTGSGYAEYRETGAIGGLPLPAGLNDGDRLPEPVFTPAWKAPLGEHDENISFERVIELVGADVAAQLRDRSLDVFARASAIAEARGLILADTKFEFGADRVTGEVTLGDEVLTPDSSRYWDASAYRSGTTPAERMASFDKQIIRNWLAANWDKTGTPPKLPDEIVEQTVARYRELEARLVG
ncbi:MAG TPA: phosphoribosylaminoimidazolesuccinocarboxamide synthase [Candidatus Lumbricidophila sp.]|nr:phosphoribosylaminoimidazolesuccinocarboxamide synthase [Candidatus Lumbricidophila sp.]